jgi:HAE1 family hydrophobic/amphiphilic exporter-1
LRLWQLAVRRPVGTSVVYLAIGLFGYVSLRQLSIDLLPSIDMPSISITTAYEGVAPEEIETLITRPLEQAVSRIQGVDRLQAVSAEGLSRIQLRFHWGQDLGEALDDVRMAIDRVRGQLPEDAEPPIVYKFDLASAPVAAIGVTGAGDPRALKRFAEDALARRLERVPGVASATARGGRDREIRIELRAERLSALGVTAEEVAAVVRTENRTVSAGDMRDAGREVVIRTAGEYERVEDIESVVVTVRDQRPVRVRDLGEVVDGAREQRSELWIDGRTGIELQIFKQSGANTLEVAEGVAREIDAINRERAGQLQLAMLWDTSKFIRSAVDNVNVSGLIGAVLALAVLLLFLGDLRATAVIATSIPLSVLATFGLMRFTGITLNLISFGGLALGIGMLVDSAIVILESIHHERGGAPPDVAAERGTAQVALAVAAGTLTTVAVFVPVVYLGDFAGVFFRELATVVSFALGASLLVALTLVPMLAARLLQRADTSRPPAFFGKALGAIEEVYGRLLAASLARPGTVVLIATVLLAMSALLLPRIGLELAPQTDEGRLDVDLELPVGTPIETTMKVIQDIEQRVRGAVRPEEIEHLVTTAGPETWWRAQGSNEGEVDVMLVPVSKRTRSSKEIEEAVHAAVAGIPGAEVRVRQFATNPLLRFMRGGGDDRLRVEIRGQELDLADALARRVVAALTDLPGVTHARPDRELGQLERVVRVDRARAAELGLGSGEIASAVEHYVLGRVATYFREHGDEYDVRVILHEADRERLSQLAQLPVLAPDGRRVPLSSLARIEQQRGPSSIARLDQERILTIDVGTAGRPLNELAADVSDALARIELPPEFSLRLSGELEEQQETFQALLFGLVLAVFLVYAVMAIQFESALHPLVVMISVPFAFTGVALALLLTSTTFNMYSFLGTIVLVGIAVNNAIVLVDYANVLRREQGKSAREALIEAGVRRLRPILMTTLTTVLGMVPLAWASGEGNEIQAPLARVVIGGLVTSTLVTLIVIPCVYVLFEALRPAAPRPAEASAREPLASPLRPRARARRPPEIR